MIKTAFVFDESGYQTPEDEMQLAVDELAALGIAVKVAKVATNMMDVYREHFDLLVIDYGGLSTMGGSHANMQVWTACKYAEDHPGALVILWSKFTERVYRGELQEAFGHLNNVLLRFEQDKTIYDDVPERFGRKVKDWFGVGQQAEA